MRSIALSIVVLAGAVLTSSGAHGGGLPNIGYPILIGGLLLLLVDLFVGIGSEK